MSLRTRLLLALVSVVAAGMIIAGAATYLLLRDSMLERVDQQLHQAVQPMAIALFSVAEGGNVPDSLNDQRGGTVLPSGTYGQLRDDSGNVLAAQIYSLTQGDQPLPVLPDPLPGATDTSGKATVFTVKSSSGESSGFRVLVQSIPQASRVIVVAIPLNETRQTLTRLLTVEALVTLCVLAALAAAAWYIVKRDLRPLEHMAITADAIAAGDLTRRVQPAEPNTEVGRLGLSLNTMLERIEEAFDERAATEEKLRRFLADASHELRTPLTSIRGYSEVFQRAKDDPENLDLAMRRIHEESKRMGVLVEELLLLARLGENRQPERVPVDLTRVVCDAVCDARATDPDRPIELKADSDLRVIGDDAQLRQVVANLVGNALRHTPAGTPVKVSLLEDAGTVVLAVSDEGPGLDPDVAAKAFEPFYRADSSRTRTTGGAGLGLAIVAAIVEAHGGRVTLQTSPGEGATFTARLPLLDETQAAAAEDETAANGEAADSDETAAIDEAAATTGEPVANGPNDDSDAAEQDTGDGAPPAGSNA